MKRSRFNESKELVKESARLTVAVASAVVGGYLLATACIGITTLLVLDLGYDWFTDNVKGRGR